MICSSLCIQAIIIHSSVDIKQRVTQMKYPLVIKTNGRSCAHEYQDHRHRHRQRQHQQQPQQQQQQQQQHNNNKNNNKNNNNG